MATTSHANLASTHEHQDTWTITLPGSVPMDLIHIPPGTYTMEMSSTDLAGCTIYTPKEIDQFGFTGPECNKPYEYQPGTYRVGIRHTPPIAKAQAYTVIFK